MPLNFTGFYFDESRNRYFPLSSQSKGSGSIADAKHRAPSSSQTSTRRSLRRSGGGAWNATERMRLGSSWVQKERLCHEIMSANVRSTTRVERSEFNSFASISAFCASRLGNRTCAFAGDESGWLYSLNETVLPDGPWSPEINLQSASHISSICMSGARCVATSFGPSCKILVQNLDSTDTFILKLGKKLVHDVWTSHLQDNHLVIGGDMKAIYLRDIDTTRSLLVLDTMSDVFAVHQYQNLVYTGARNGAIARFDLRVDHPRGLQLFDSHSVARNSVTHLSIVHEWQLLVGQLNGELATYDLRYPRGSNPVLSLLGSMNHYSNVHPVHPAIAVTPDQDFVFAVGADEDIRAWSLRTGQLLRPPADSTPPSIPLLGPLAPQPQRTVIVAMQMTEEQEGLCLWVASRQETMKYWIGQRQLAENLDDAAV